GLRAVAAGGRIEIEAAQAVVDACQGEHSNGRGRRCCRFGCNCHKGIMPPARRSAGDYGRCRTRSSMILCTRVDTDGIVVSMLLDYPQRIGDASGRAPITAAQNDLPVAFSPACARLSSAPTEFVQTFVVDAVEVGDLVDDGDDDLLAQVVAVLGEVDEVVTVDEDVVGQL